MNFLSFDPMKKIRNMRYLARGGSGIIHLAEHDRYGPVALKQVQNDAEGRHEAEMLRRVAAANNRNPRHVCRIHDSFEKDLDFFMVLDRFAAPLEKYQSAYSSPFSLIVLGIESAKGILEMENADIRDDDIKPGNLAIAESGRLSHIDLGAARLSGQAPIGSTAGYAAPEIDAGEPSDSSPIYSWARSMEFFAVGQPGIAPSTLLSSVRPWIGREFSELIAQCCRTEPKQRPSVAELLDRMREIRARSQPCRRCAEGYRRFGDSPCHRCGHAS